MVQKNPLKTTFAIITKERMNMKKNVWIIILLISLAMIITGIIIWNINKKNPPKNDSSKVEKQEEKKKEYECIHDGTITLEDVQITANFERKYQVIINDKNTILSKKYTLQYL